MNAEHHALAVRWFEEVWNQRRVETVHELLAVDAPGHMEGQKVIGPKDFLPIHKAMLTMMPDLAVQIEEVLSDGDDAVVRWRINGTHSGAGLGCSPTGQKVSFPGITWFKFRDGQIVEGWDAWNQGGLVLQLQAPRAV